MGCILGIPEDIMGLTLTAGGTSLPNMFSSMIVAKQGLGTMSVSNAFGSNTFNIFIALALPWFVGASRNPTTPRPFPFRIDRRKRPRGSCHLICRRNLPCPDS